MPIREVRLVREEKMAEVETKVRAAHGLEDDIKAVKEVQEETKE